MKINKVIDQVVNYFIKSAKKSLHTTSYRGTYQPDLRKIKGENAR
ncbi:MAG: hypothetical protein ACK5L6_03990 [Anaerorhabdus sp.]